MQWAGQCSSRHCGCGNQDSIAELTLERPARSMIRRQLSSTKQQLDGNSDSADWSTIDLSRRAQRSISLIFTSIHDALREAPGGPTTRSDANSIYYSWSRSSRAFLRGLWLLRAERLVMDQSHCWYLEMQLRKPDSPTALPPFPTEPYP